MDELLHAAILEREVSRQTRLGIYALVALAIAQGVLIAAKLAGFLMWGWAVVLIPLAVPGCLLAAFLALALVAYLVIVLAMIAKVIYDAFSDVKP